MKIIAVIGSPRGMQGNTGRLLEEVLAGAGEAGADTEILSLATLNIKPCVACDVCHRTGVCNIKDDYEAMKEKLLACDGFILASPNYIVSVSAQMKAFFDRCNGLIHCQTLEGKYAAAVETSGAGEDKFVLNYMERFSQLLGASSVGGVGSHTSGVRTFPESEALFAHAAQLGRELCRCIEEKRTFPNQQIFRDNIKGRMMTLVDMMRDDWIFERDYWAKKSAD